MNEDRNYITSECLVYETEMFFRDEIKARTIRKVKRVLLEK